MSLSLYQQLDQTLSRAQQALGMSNADPLPLQPTRPEFTGEVTATVFALAKRLGQAPEAAGKALGEQLLALPDSPVIAYETVKGFLNLTLSPVWLLGKFGALGDPALPAPPTGERVMVEYSSPNTNKPLHLGHMRNIFLGHAMAELYRAAGHEVVRANLVNDRGIHICKSMVAYQYHGQGETPASSGLKGDHLIGKYYVLFDRHNKEQLAKLKEAERPETDSVLMQRAQQMLRDWEAGDPGVVALWRQLNGWVYEGFHESYARMGVTFDRFYYESDTYLLGKDIVEEGLAKGVFVRREDGSVWADLSDEPWAAGDESQGMKLVLRADGTSVYITQDLGTADLKYQDYQVGRSIYVVGNEQDYHFKVLFALLTRLDRPYAAGLRHLSYGMVNLPHGRMKSREGTVVDADDLMDEMITEATARSQELGKVAELDPTEAAEVCRMIGLGAIKYYLLRVEPRKTMTFNPAESIDLQGNTATALQYTHARMSSILRRGHEAGYSMVTESDPASLTTEEKTLLIQLIQYRETVAEAAETMSPALLCGYAYDLTRNLNRFLTQCPVLSAPQEETRSFRLALLDKSRATLQAACHILGIGLPERM